MAVGLEAVTAQEEWKQAARGAGNLSELHLTLGNVAQAVDVARQSVEYADRSGANFERVVFRTALAEALHQAGQAAEATKLFAEAEAIQKERQPGYPLLYSFQGYLYCDLLLAHGQREEVHRRAAQTLEWVKRQAWLLDIALDHLSLGCALPPESEEAAAHLNEAVDGLRKAGQDDQLPRGLLARAALRRQRGDFAAAHRDLDEVFALATRSSMRLHLTDYHLEQARLLLAQGDRDKARRHLDTAKQLIAATGYRRRDGEAAELETQLGKPFTPPAPRAPRPSAGRLRGSGGG
jgi:tetratricopeptide (TPR) repeat protein